MTDLPPIPPQQTSVQFYIKQSSDISAWSHKPYSSGISAHCHANVEDLAIFEVSVSLVLYLNLTEFTALPVAISWIDTSILNVTGGSDWPNNSVPQQGLSHSGRVSQPDDQGNCDINVYSLTIM